MTTLKGFKKRLEVLDIDKKVPEIIKDTSGTLISLQQKRIFNTGKDTDGEVMGTYSALTQAITDGRKRQGKHYTLFDTGGFFRGFNIKVDKDKIIFDSSDYKTELLEDRLGPHILGLSPFDRSQYIKGPGLFFSRLKAYIESTLRLKFTR